MTYHTSTLVTLEPPNALLNVGPGRKPIPVIRFSGNEFTVQLAHSMTADEQAAWLRTLAEAASDLAIQVERANAEQVPA